ncbi:MAG: membrane protein insertion efficiency factor YidD [Candidatus Gracilibacteria bacterium]|nr:membrane protein insertion efficiency factor YidD [Candidatus Gracilibacteria bacterium]
MRFWHVLTWPDRALARLVILLIRGYQATFSPDHSVSATGNPLRTCKFYPTCSEYAVSTLKKQGFLFGLPRVIWRVLRCHPWSRGGVDLPK